MYYICHTKLYLYNNCNTNCITNVLQNQMSCITNVIQAFRIMHSCFGCYLYEFIAYILKLQSNDMCGSC